MAEKVVSLRPAAVPTFGDEARERGVVFTFDNGRTAQCQLPETMSGGVALLDFDGDGWLDIFAVQGGKFPPPAGPAPFGDRLFRNRGDGRFDDVTGSPVWPCSPAVTAMASPSATMITTAGPTSSSHAGGAYLCTTTGATDASKTPLPPPDSPAIATGRLPPHGPTSTTTATSTFMSAIISSGTHSTRLSARCGKDENIYCDPRFFPSLPDHVFRNDGGRFVDVTEQGGFVDREGRGLGVVAADFDADGRTDIFVANDTTANYLYHNQGEFRFTEQGQEAGVAASSSGGYQAGMGVACADFDGDGLVDLAVTNFYAESTSLYQNLGGGLFTDRTAAAGLSAATRFVLGFGLTALDANNDMGRCRSGSNQTPRRARAELPESVLAASQAAKSRLAMAWPSTYPTIAEAQTEKRACPREAPRPPSGVLSPEAGEVQVGFDLGLTSISPRQKSFACGQQVIAQRLGDRQYVVDEGKNRPSERKTGEGCRGMRFEHGIRRRYHQEGAR